MSKLHLCLFAQFVRHKKTYCESFNARFGDELQNGEVFYSLKKTKTNIDEWRKHYNTKRPYSALSYRPSVPETV